MHRVRGATFIAGGVVILALIAGLSFFFVLDLPFWITKSEWVMLHFYHGRGRIFWVRVYGDPIDVVSYHEPPSIRLSVRPPGAEPMSSRGRDPKPPMLNTDFRIDIGTSWSIDDWGMGYSRLYSLPGSPGTRVRNAFIRIPLWLVGSVLLLIPIRAAIFGPIRFRRRNRRNLCGYCGYDLTGLPQARCPECGNET